MPAPRIVLDLPLAPSINNAKGLGARKKSRTALIEDDSGRVRVKTGMEWRAHLYTLPHVRRWRNEASQEIIAQRPGWSHRHLPAGWYAVRILIPADAPPDTDNVVKLTIDVLHYMRLTPDDAHLWAESARRSHLILPGRCRVTAWSIGARP